MKTVTEQLQKVIKVIDHAPRTKGGLHLGNSLSIVGHDDGVFLISHGKDSRFHQLDNDTMHFLLQWIDEYRANLREYYMTQPEDPSWRKQVREGRIHEIDEEMEKLRTEKQKILELP